MPANDTEALAMLNQRLSSEGLEPVPADKALFVYPEAANRNYISKYNMFLGLSTLKNIAATGQAGVSFMNSHRTGGTSTPAELPDVRGPGRNPDGPGRDEDAPDDPGRLHGFRPEAERRQRADDRRPLPVDP
jgi:hypothetical protein